MLIHISQSRYGLRYSANGEDISRRKLLIHYYYTQFAKQLLPNDLDDRGPFVRKVKVYAIAASMKPKSRIQLLFQTGVFRDSFCKTCV